jgi:hypothetical protein
MIDNFPWRLCTTFQRHHIRNGPSSTYSSSAFNLLEMSKNQCRQICYNLELFRAGPDSWIVNILITSFFRTSRSRVSVFEKACHPSACRASRNGTRPSAISPSQRVCTSIEIGFEYHVTLLQIFFLQRNYCL